jgi:hypothetical protein
MSKIKPEFRLVRNNDGLFHLFGTGIEKGTVLDLLDFPYIRCWLLVKSADGGALHLPPQLMNRFLLESSFPYDELNELAFAF